MYWKLWDSVTLPHGANSEMIVIETSSNNSFPLLSADTHTDRITLTIDQMIII